MGQTGEHSKIPTKIVDLTPGTATSGGLGAAEGGCARCEAFEAELLRAKQEKEAAIRALAEERERTEALRLNYPTSKHEVGSHLSPEALNPPLRYVLADALNDFLKKYLRYLHLGMHRAASSVRGVPRQPERKR